MKLNKLFAVTLAILLAVSLLAGCSAQAPKENGMAYDDYVAVDKEAALSKPSEESSQSSTPLNQKLIRTVRLNAETEDLDATLTQINDRISQLNGYVEAKQVYHGSAYSSRSSRYAELTIRIPVASLDLFIDHVSENSNITSSNESTQDVTLSYVATQSRITALETEEKRLLELLAKAETMDDLLLIESRLTEVRSELEKHVSQLRLYDNLVDYGTINLNLQEVKQFTVVEEPETVWERISSGFMENLRDLGDGIVELFVFLVVALPYLVLIAAIAVVVILLIKHRKVKKQKKITPPQENNPQ